ncbi:MAG: hypothetical protein CMJ35_13610 [Phycisphaerae bacterium]|nr:hypothetical protein [Phycisphaerae bacterium]MBM91500.1 hypothetical protein [Phycisphaerae bacterium]MBM92630.1 hypothetical protein [Phycisphaerae bacterium]|tara:strand:- start:146 stop:703 length:558 start_codon:yes stop_codon:yes gene_type:complete
MSNKNRDHGLLRIHAVGAIACLLVAGGSVWFATHSVAKRRGLFLSARHELTTTKNQLNETVSTRSGLATMVQRLERITSQELDLVSVKQINARSADIVELAENAGLSVDSLQPLDMITDARVPVQPLELIGRADADEVSDMLAQLEANMPDTHIQSIELSSEVFGSQQVRVRMLMYWFVDPVEQS